MKYKVHYKQINTDNDGSEYVSYNTFEAPCECELAEALRFFDIASTISVSLIEIVEQEGYGNY